MPDVIDGSFNDTNGRKKVFVKQRPDESSDEFATRAMAFFLATSDGHILDKVMLSAADDWEILASDSWLEARSWVHPMLRTRLTELPSKGGATVGHLVVECDSDQVADYWGHQVGRVFLPRPDSGSITSGEAKIWSLVHEIRGLDSEYEQTFRRAFAPNLEGDDVVPPGSSER